MLHTKKNSDISDYRTDTINERNKNFDFRIQ